MNTNTVVKLIPKIYSKSLSDPIDTYGIVDGFGVFVEYNTHVKWLNGFSNCYKQTDLIIYNKSWI